MPRLSVEPEMAYTCHSMTACSIELAMRLAAMLLAYCRKPGTRRTFSIYLRPEAYNEFFS